MRGKHRHFIEMVNAYEPCWFYVNMDDGLYYSRTPLTYDLPDGTQVIIPETFGSDLFSCVPDTDYFQFYLSARLHDYLRKQKKYSRFFSDIAFIFDMIKRIGVIFTRLIDSDCPKKVREKEVIRLCRIAALYLLGVSGILGSIYMKLDKWF